VACAQTIPQTRNKQQIESAIERINFLLHEKQTDQFVFSVKTQLKEGTQL
jgi:hypothetical protein